MLLQMNVAPIRQLYKIKMVSSDMQDKALAALIFAGKKIINNQVSQTFS